MVRDGVVVEKTFMRVVEAEPVWRLRSKRVRRDECKVK